MEIKDYIAETLVQITEGIKEAQKRLKDEDVIVNPARLSVARGIIGLGNSKSMVLCYVGYRKLR